MNISLVHAMLIVIGPFFEVSDFQSDSLRTQKLLKNHIALNIPRTYTPLKTKRVKQQNILSLPFDACEGVHSNDAILVAFHTTIALPEKDNGLMIWKLFENSGIKDGKFVKSGYRVNNSKKVYYLIQSSFDKEFNNEWKQSYRILFASEMQGKLIYGVLKIVPPAHTTDTSFLIEFIKSIQVID
jgi:hypothetical protein